MRLRPDRHVLPVLLATGPLAGLAHADAIYSNLQGNYVAEQTSSIKVSKGTYGPNGYSDGYDFGATTFGDDYSVSATAPTMFLNGQTAVEIQGFSFYGTLTPSAGNPVGSLGTRVSLYFYGKNADGSPVATPYRVYSFTEEAQGGPRLHSISFTSPTYVPASGFVAMQFSLFAANGGNGTTPNSFGEVALTGYFGAAPTVGSNDPTKYLRLDTNGAQTRPAAAANSPANLQFQLDGLAGPTPATLYFTGALSGSLNTTANYAANAAGTTPATAAPGGITDVYFGATNASTASLADASLSLATSVNSLTFGTGGGAGAPVTVRGLSTLTINAAGGAYAAGTGIVKQAGSGTVTLSPAVALASSQTWTNGAATALTLDGNVNLGANRLTVSGTGNFTINGVTSGSNGGLTSATSGTTTLTGFSNYTGATIVTAGTLRAKSGAYNNFLANAGGVDVQAGAFVFDYAGGFSPATTIRSLLAASFTAAATPGVMDTGQFRSSTATTKKGLGYKDDGAGNVLVKVALYGDADLDGGVSINDFNALAGNFGQSSGKVWVDGDFDYDGGVSINDFNLLAGGFGQSLPATSQMWAGLLAFAAAHNDLVAFEAVTGVPEPTTLAIIGVAAFGLRRRRTPVASRLQGMV